MLTSKEYIKMLSQSKLTKGKFDILLKSKGVQFDDTNLDSYWYAVVKWFRWTKMDFDLTESEKLSWVEKKVDVVSSKLYEEVSKIDDKVEVLYTDNNKFKQVINDTVKVSLYNINTIKKDVSAINDDISKTKQNNESNLKDLKSDIQNVSSSVSHIKPTIDKIQSQISSVDTYHNDRVSGVIWTLKMKSDKGHKHLLEDISGLSQELSDIKTDIAKKDSELNKRITNEKQDLSDFYTKKETYNRKEINEKITRAWGWLWVVWAQINDWTISPLLTWSSARINQEIQAWWGWWGSWALVHPTVGSTFESAYAPPSMTGTYNSSIGVDSLMSLTTGLWNTNFWWWSLIWVTTAEWNVSFGSWNGTNLTSWWKNILVGNWLLPAWDTAHDNIIIWTDSGISLTIWYQNFLFGNVLLTAWGNVNNNYAFWYNSLTSLISWWGNFSFGAWNLNWISTEWWNTAVGSSIFSGTAVTNSTWIWQTLWASWSTVENATFIGTSIAWASATDVDNTIAIGSGIFSWWNSTITQCYAIWTNIWQAENSSRGNWFFMWGSLAQNVTSVSESYLAWFLIAASPDWFWSIDWCTLIGSNIASTSGILDITDTIIIWHNNALNIATSTNNILLWSNIWTSFTTHSRNIVLWDYSMNTANGDNNIVMWYRALLDWTTTDSNFNLLLGDWSMIHWYGSHNVWLWVSTFMDSNALDNCVAVWYQALNNLVTWDSVIGLGRGCKTTSTTASNQFVMGSETYPVTDLYLGRWWASSTAPAWNSVTLQPTTASSWTGANFILRAWAWTGSATTDQIKLKADGKVSFNSLTASRAVVTDASKNLASSATTATELWYVNGVTSAIQTQLNSKITANGAITWATKTKITYDTNWLVTAWADATTADIADSTGRRYTTEAQQTTLWAIWMMLSAGYAGATLWSGATNYEVLNWLTTTFAAEWNRMTVVWATCTAKNLFIRTDNAQTGTWSFVFTVRKNGADTSIVVTVAAWSAAWTFSDTSNTASFTAGDRISLKGVNNGSATSAQVWGASLMLYV